MGNPFSQSAIAEAGKVRVDFKERQFSYSGLITAEALAIAVRSLMAAIAGLSRR